MNFDWIDEITPYIFPALVIFLLSKILDSLKELRTAVKGPVCSHCEQRHHYSTHQCKREEKEWEREYE